MKCILPVLVLVLKQKCHLRALMEGLFSECGPKIFSRGRNETKLHLVSKQLFTDGVLLRLAEGEAELRR